jgi:hypothetical protein
LALLLMMPAAASAQSVRVVPNMAVAESEYRDALEAWLRNDPNLEQDLYRRSREEMRTRIHRAASLRDDAMSKKEVYLGFLAGHFEDIRARLAIPAAGGIPVEQIKRGLEQERARLRAEQERLESLIQDGPQGDEYRRTMEAEKSDLIALQNTVDLRMRSLERIGASQRADAETDAEALGEKLDEIGRVWASEHDRAVRERASWVRYYKDLEDSLSHNTDAGGPHPAGRRTSRSRDGNNPSAQPAAATQPASMSGRLRTMDGAWVYASRPGAWTGFGEPQSVQLELKRDGTDIEGTYVARLPGLRDMRQLNLSFHGRLLSAREAKVQWVSQRPVAHGEMELKLGSDGRLLVQRLSSDDSYIPTGMEVLLPR